MVFSSLTFLFVFVPLVFGIYYIVPAKAKNIIIFLSGFIFYAWGEPFYICIMILSTLIDYTAGLLLARYDKNPKVRTILLLVSVVMNLSLLATFKYSSFIINNINAILHTSIPDPNLPLPIGISFYTFQSMSYTIDLYMRKINVQKNLINFVSYVTLFPQLVAGPIVRYQDVQNEIDHRTITVTKVSAGIGLFIQGLAKKVLLANNIGLLWTNIKAMDYATMPAMTAWLGILAFTFQIYYDFSGYSDMACGLGKMLGFEFPQNFNLPYTAKSIAEFWRRWHITLSSWFKSYVYFPLGGSRVSKPKIVRNLLIVWGLTGLWHGASWNFILWGLYFGILIICERFIWGKALQKLPGIIQHIYTFVLVVFGWMLFEILTVTDIITYTKALFGAGGLWDSQSFYFLSSYFILFIICAIFSGGFLQRLGTKLAARFPKAVPYSIPVVQLVLMVCCLSYLVSSTYNPFLYFRF